jgi:hypothetical protein
MLTVKNTAFKVVTGLQVGEAQTFRGKILLPSSGQIGKQAIS